MKRALLMLFAVGAICLTACEKDQLTSPGGDSIKMDKDIQCHQCGGGWDFGGSGDGGDGPNGFRYSPTTDTVSVSAPIKPVPVKGKK